MSSKKLPQTRSKFEADIGEFLTKNRIKYQYEPKDGKISYKIPASLHWYLPDYIITTKSGKKIIIECKGIWDFKDRYKHFLIKKTHPDLDIRFVFYNANNKIRKGSKTTYSDICEGKGRGYFKGVKWKYAHQRPPIEWFEE